MSMAMMMMTSISLLIAAMTIRPISGLVSEVVMDDKDLVLGRVMRLLWSGCMVT